MNYTKRRQTLRAALPKGDILILSAAYAPRNYAANTYPFHQDATFRYFTGLKDPNAALLIDDSGKETLFISVPDPDDVIWTGPVPSPRELADRAGIANTADYADLGKYLSPNTLWIEPYDFQLKLRLASWLGISAKDLTVRASRELGRAIIALRSIKDDDEIAELDAAIALTRRMLANARAAIEPGRLESDILAALLAPAIAKERAQAFEPIVTTHGETLHNESYCHIIMPSDMVLVDCGAESVEGYCADITRTFPAGDNFTARQRAIYNAVLSAQKAGIAQTAVKGTSQYDVHMAACRALTIALQEIGLMQGDIEESLVMGAHAIFMPHGIGHMLGLDAHDMENFGDDVGYAPGTSRSTQFGLNALRLHRRLEPGFVLTVEPGCYFIPELIDRWQATHHLEQFINYRELEKYRDSRGIRIEDDILITPNGSRILGPGIEK
ncbi:MAG: aminopeptidase P N-terminal domain-containing protein [Proteobacteria bacterium]|nr:aminopeptidase P N-terminal domain-containing protein [Pseudomonadota bacterium]